MRRKWPTIPSAESRNLRPSTCQGCNGLIGGIGMTLMHGKWLCDLCQDKEKRGLPLPVDEKKKEQEHGE